MAIKPFLTNEKSPLTTFLTPDPPVDDNTASRALSDVCLYGLAVAGAVAAQVTPTRVKQTVIVVRSRRNEGVTRSKQIVLH